MEQKKATNEDCVYASIYINGYLAVDAQKRQTKAPASPKTVCRGDRKLIDPDKPIVFLTFLRKERIETAQFGGRDADYLFFAIKNNFCSPIMLQMSGAGPRFGDARLYAAVEEVASGKLIWGALDCHVCSINRLLPGETIRFTIPFRYVGRGNLMRLAYEFEWERETGVESSNSLHSVAYYFNGLPDSVLPKPVNR